MEQQSHTQGVRRNTTRGNIQRTKSSGASPTQGNYQDAYDEEEYDDVWPSRMPSSVRRYQSDVKTESGRPASDVQPLSRRSYQTSSPGRSTVPPRRTATQVNLPVAQTPRKRLVDMEGVSPRKSGDLGENERRIHWLVYIGLAMIIMLVGWMLLTMFLNWWQITQDDLHYGRPRTAQYDVVVGHNDSKANPSHFIALNLNRHVEIIECPAGDCSKARVMMGPILIGQGQDLAPVTLTFKDVNGDGKPDIIVNVQDSHFVFINDNGTFRPTRPSDNIQL